MLYRNNGDRTFTDVTDAAPGSGRTDGHGFGVVAADLNDDGLIDLFVANDMNPNFVFLNRGDGTFEDVTETSGAALRRARAGQVGMGVDAEDVDGDGLPELFVTNFANEYNTLYQNLGNGTFLDVTPLIRAGLRQHALGRMGLRPGRLRQRRLARLLRRQRPRRRQPPPPRPARRPTRSPPCSTATWQGKRFRPATSDAGPYFDTDHVGRGAAFGDLDNDGDIDIVVNHKDGPPAVLRNDTPAENHWIRRRAGGDAEQSRRRRGRGSRSSPAAAPSAASGRGDRA